MSGTIKENISEILKKIREAEQLAGRKEGSVNLLAVSKFHPAEAVMEAVQTGQFSFGENRVQEAFAKFSEVRTKIPNVDLHIIGQLQTNKVKKAVQIASMIESVDRISLIAEIEKHAAAQEKKIHILLEFHTAEDSKSGFMTEEALEAALNFIATGNAPHVIPCGFMTMAPFTQDKDRIRKSFSYMRKVSEELQKKFPQFELKTLSMGMSGDFDIAIQEGSTQVRVGTAIFGERDYGTK